MAKNPEFVGATGGMVENASALGTRTVSLEAFRVKKSISAMVGQLGALPESDHILGPEVTPMSDVTREEHDAKLEAVEARVETKLVMIDSKLDRIGDQITSAVQRLSGEVAGATDAARRAESQADAARSAAAGMKWNIFFTALGAVGVMIAFWAVWQDAVSTIAGFLANPPAGSP